MKRLSLILLLVLFVFALSGCKKDSDTLIIGSKDFTESDILGDMLTILINENTDITAEHKRGLSSDIIFEAIKSGDVNAYVDYTGTIYGSYLKYDDIKSAEEVYQIAVDGLKEQFSLQMLEPLGFNNTFTLSVRRDTADEYGLVTYSDLAEVSPELVLGATIEILNRHDGIPNLKQVYDMEFKDEVAVEGTLRYTAIANDEIQITNAFSTDGLLMEYGLVVLEDDKSFFPPYHAAIVISDAAAEKHPELIELFSRLSGTISDDVMRDLNYRVDVLGETPDAVASEFLRDLGLIR